MFGGKGKFLGIRNQLININGKTIFSMNYIPWNFHVSQVVQQRGDFGRVHENFTKSWRDYKYGFGEFLSEFWYGNEYIHMLTKDQPMVIRIELEDFNSNYAFAEYSKFR